MQQQSYQVSFSFFKKKKITYTYLQGSYDYHQAFFEWPREEHHSNALSTYFGHSYVQTSDG